MGRPDRAFHILMADDDPDDCLLLADALAQCGLPHRLATVGDGEALLDYLAGCLTCRAAEPCALPDLILLDLNMPRHDGREALRSLRQDQRWRRIPIVVLTTSTSAADVQFVYELGASSYIAKPAQFAGWVQLVKQLDEYWFRLVELPPRE